MEYKDRDVVELIPLQAIRPPSRVKACVMDAYAHYDFEYMERQVGRLGSVLVYAPGFEAAGATIDQVRLDRLKEAYGVDRAELRAESIHNIPPIHVEKHGTGDSACYTITNGCHRVVAAILFSDDTHIRAVIKD